MVEGVKRVHTNGGRYGTVQGVLYPRLHEVEAADDVCGEVRERLEVRLDDEGDKVRRKHGV